MERASGGLSHHHLMSNSGCEHLSVPVVSSNACGCVSRICLMWCVSLL